MRELLYGDLRYLKIRCVLSLKLVYKLFFWKIAEYSQNATVNQMFTVFNPFHPQRWNSAERLGHDFAKKVVGQ